MIPSPPPYAYVSSVPMALPRAWRRVRVGAVVLMIGGVLAGFGGLASAASDVCAFVPCEGWVEVGLRSSPDDATALIAEVGPLAAEDARVLYVDDADGNIVWQVERVEPSADGFDRTFVVGTDVEGFATVTELNGSLPEQGWVNVEGACASGYAPLRTGLPSDVLTDSYGDRYTAEEFAAFDAGLGCPSVRPPLLALALLLGGFVALSVGIVLVIVASTRQRVPADPGAALPPLLRPPTIG